MPNQNDQLPGAGGAAEIVHNQAGQDQKDDPRHAAESGDPDLAGHVQGHVSADDANDDAAADDPDRPRRRQAGDQDEDWESGRQAAL